MLANNELISLLVAKVSESDIHQRFPFDRNGIKLKDINRFTTLNLASNFCVNRSSVLEVYSQKNNLFESFILAMIWGGIRKNNLAAILEYNPSILIDKLEKLDAIIENQGIEFAVKEYLKNETLHIKGVGLSFITKHFYFRNSSEMFIYDKWTKRFHAAYIKSTNPEKLPLYFLNSTTFNLKGVEDDLIIRIGYEGIAYQDFCIALKAIYSSINNLLSKEKQFKSVGHLESYLFGEGGRNKYDKDNPRVWLYDFIKQ
jgi:hypothetical protein